MVPKREKQIERNGKKEEQVPYRRIKEKKERNQTQSDEYRGGKKKRNNKGIHGRRRPEYVKAFPFNRIRYSH